MQTDVERTQEAYWTPDAFVRLCNGQGWTGDGELAKEAGVSEEQVRNIHEGGVITEDAADGIAPLIGMTGVGLLTCVNAYSVATQLATGEMALREAFEDSRVIVGRFQRSYEAETELSAVEMDLCKAALFVMDDVIRRDLELRRQNANLWPGVNSSWIASPEEVRPETLATRAG